jgi:hypothetical protein
MTSMESSPKNMLSLSLQRRNDDREYEEEPDEEVVELLLCGRTRKGFATAVAKTVVGTIVEVE